MWKWFALFLFLTAIRTHAVTSPEYAAEVSLFQKGYEEFKDKSYEDAIEKFTDTLKQSKIISDYAYFYRAQSYIALKKWKEAQRDLQEISVKESHFKLFLDSRIMLAQVYFQLNQPGEVKGLFTKLLRRVKVTRAVNI
jgi:soluble lytic murein transglycosylase